MKTNNSFSFRFLCVIICACSKDILDERHIEREDLVLTKVQTGYLESGNEFGLTLFKCLEDIDQTSQIISPLSLQVALGMLVAGADGDTAGEIVSALGFGENAAETMDYLSSLLSTTSPYGPSNGFFAGKLSFVEF
jgi:Serpin (serine protease inhibitor).